MKCKCGCLNMIFIGIDKKGENYVCPECGKMIAGGKEL
jgi:predicted RNA-binding Zn-ribbon protein involved in translation (DUF1610 family)